MLSVTFIYGCSIGQNKSVDAPTEKIIQTVSGMYKSYSSIDELVDYSDLVIEGKVLNSRVEILDISMEPEDPTPENSPGERVKAEYINTVSKVEVSKVYKGDVEEKQIIEVKQMGGETEYAILISEQSTYLEEGENVVLFLKTYNNSPATLLNPTQAQYIIDDNKVVKLEENNLNLEIDKLESIASEER